MLNQLLSQITSARLLTKSTAVLFVIALLLQSALAIPATPERAAINALTRRNKGAFVAALEAGANVNAKDKYGSPLLMLTSKIFPDLVPELVERGANVNYRTSTDGQTPLLEAMLQRNLENVEALLDAGATFKGDERRIAQNILSSVPDVEIAKLLGFPTVDDNGDPIDQHEMFAWARETRYARETCADSLKVFRARTEEFLTGVGTLTLGEFDPEFPPAAVLEELDEYTLVATSSTLVDRVDSEQWLTSTWGSSGSSGYEYMFFLVSRHDPVFCAFMAIGY